MLGVCAVCGYEKGIGECEMCSLRSRLAAAEARVKELEERRYNKVEEEALIVVHKYAGAKAEIAHLREGLERIKLKSPPSMEEDGSITTTEIYDIARQYLEGGGE